MAGSPQNETPSFYSVLPATVRYCKGLSAQEKLLYSEITALTNKKGYCWATNNYFANLYRLSKETVSRQISKLVELGFITVTTESDIKIIQELKAKNMDGFGIGDKKCAWCGVRTIVLHPHHYPTPKSKGGIETIDICPNCHSEFHCRLRHIKLNLTIKEFEELMQEYDRIYMTEQ